MAERAFAVAIPPGMRAPALDEAMVGAGEAIIYAWRQLAATEGAVDTGAYLAALTPEKALRYPYGDENAVAVVNTTPQAWWLEHGRAGFHLPSRWSHWKVSKQGKLYARVPFRIRTPLTDGGGASSSRARLGGTMPRAVYQQARALQFGGGSLSFGANAYRQSKSYDYYRKVFGDFPEELRDVRGYTWKTGQYEGLFFAGMHATPGGGTQGMYYTIRTITPHSPGWYIPPTPARRFAERALDMTGQAIDEMLQGAAAADLEMAMLAAAQGKLAA